MGRSDRFDVRGKGSSAEPSSKKSGEAHPAAISPDTSRPRGCPSKWAYTEHEKPKWAYTEAAGVSHERRFTRIMNTM